MGSTTDAPPVHASGPAGSLDVTWSGAVRWAGHERSPLHVQEPGFLDCHLYRQGERRVLHLVNLTPSVPWTGQLAQTVPVGPLTVRLPFLGGARLRLLVAGGTACTEQDGDELAFTIPRVDTHEVCVVEPDDPSREGRHPDD